MAVVLPTFALEWRRIRPTHAGLQISNRSLGRWYSEGFEFANRGMCLA